MRAIDTNVVVRFLTGDDPVQAQASRAVIAAGDIFIATTVLLETEWVLRSGYGFEASRIGAAMRALAGLAGVTVEEPMVLARALDWHEAGMDFADALHLSKTTGCEVFLTFDRRLAKAAEALAPIKVESP
ncbi:tRNA(fMet)-specific endonuclease VapC [Brevundimonas sp. SH203]|uniref:type II toxin-antitoxin system VapC family toxin n=1 Tax=Brevundimonas sp. SH203 TaxID=345167 RepID=UPI0009D33D24|nr:type II toxin-antitoxin system VapC family toxin [Brevundimonas sp. SH203]GAW40559.1 tRNA(fMet)-specific endonuclease VapC [Brevundimonas sp. SH203]